jgi:circadian clock protein KaiB
MNNDEMSETTKKFEQLASEEQKDTYVLRLYIAGNTARSAEAIVNIREICETRLKGRYTLEVIDIYQQPGLAKGEQIIAVPTLIKFLPLPLKKIIGDLSKTERVIYGLDLRKIDQDNNSQDNQPNTKSDA